MNVNAKLRHLEAFPIEQDGKRMIALRDPLGILQGAAVVAPEFFLIACHFDGTRGLAEVQQEVRRSMGLRVQIDDLRNLLQALDQHLLLENERFLQELERQARAFAASPTRPPFHAGTVYPKEEEKARAQIEAMLGPFGKGGPPAQRARALLAPHIDFPRGGETYGRAYAALRGIESPDLILVLGTSHQPTESLICLTRKDYETPFGPARTEGEVVERLAGLLPGEPFGDEYCHRTEHSVEFQIYFLKFLFPEVPVVPVLCGGLLGRFPNGADPAESDEVERSVAALREGMRGRKYPLLVLGVDLAHVGPRFGTRAPWGAPYLEQIGREDRTSLERAAAADAAGFFRSVAEGGDPRNVCGLSPTYLGLRLLEGAKGRLLDYRQCTSEDQSVTIAGMVFE